MSAVPENLQPQKSPWEEAMEESLQCGATRGPRSRVRCENVVGHEDNPYCSEHMGRGRTGQWFIWEDFDAV